MSGRETDERRRDGRKTFNDVAARYDRARPAYPREVVDAVVRCGDVGAESAVLEIGCGSGQLTVPLAARGAAIVAVELGAELAGLAAKRLETFPQVQVIEADFDQWSIPRAAFDVVVAATAFHWLDPMTRLERCVRALRPSGVLVIVETHWSAGSGVDQFFRASQDCYAKWDPHHDPNFVPVTAETLLGRNAELEACELLHDVEVCDVVHERTYTAVQYRELLETFSNVQQLGARAAAGFVACVERLVDEQFGGVVLRRDLYRVWSAKTCSDSRSEAR